VIPKSNSLKCFSEDFDCLFDLGPVDFTIIDKLMGGKSEQGVRNLEIREHLGFDIFNEEF
jgi:hypothetical protein